MNSLKIEEADEIKLEPRTHSYFNIDGEIWPNDQVTVTNLPGYLKLLGKVFPKDDN
jgi:diacylglycerol kinase family enzyme